METKIKTDKIEEMFKAGAHFGYSRSRRHPKMKDFIFGLKNNIEIFDLEKVRQKLDEAKEFVKSLGKGKKAVLFVGTKAQIRELVKKYAEEISMPYVIERWIGGALTNFNSIKSRRDLMEELEQKKESGELGKYTKKEQSQIEKKISRLNHYFSGLRPLKKLPSAIVVIDTKKDGIAAREAKKMMIPVVGIMNSDCDPELADYIIPANDNSISSVDFMLRELSEAYLDGIKEAPAEEDKTEENKTDNNKTKKE